MFKSILSIGLVLIVTIAQAQVTEYTAPNGNFAESYGLRIGALGGDINSDGSDDFVVSSLGPLSPPFSGSVGLISGADGSLIRQLSSPVSPYDFQLFASIEAIHDVNTDSVPDVLAGSGSDPGSLAGRVYLFSSADGTILHTFVSPNETAGFNFSVPKVVGDLNNDAIPDIVIGELQATVSSTANAGRVHVYSGLSPFGLIYSVDNPRPSAASPAAAYTEFGRRIVDLPDLNGDGRAEFGVCAGEINTASDPLVIVSGIDGAILDELQSPNGPDTQFFGYNVVSYPDLNSDSVPELLIGSPYEDLGGSANVGAVFLYSGNDRALLDTIWPDQPIADLGFGAAVASIEDFSGDSFPEYVFSAEDTGTGSAIYFYEDIMASASLMLNNPDISSGFPFDALQTGDFNGDGNQDLLYTARTDTVYAYTGEAVLAVESIDDMTGLSLSNPVDAPLTIGSFDLVNYGFREPLDLSAITFNFTGLDAGRFQIDGDPSSLTLDPGGRVAVDIQLLPGGGDGPFIAQLEIAHPSGSPVTVDIDGAVFTLQQQSGTVYFINHELNVGTSIVQVDPGSRDRVRITGYLPVDPFDELESMDIKNCPPNEVLVKYNLLGLDPDRGAFMVKYSKLSGEMTAVEHIAPSADPARLPRFNAIAVEPSGSILAIQNNLGETTPTLYRYSADLSSRTPLLGGEMTEQLPSSGEPTFQRNYSDMEVAPDGNIYLSIQPSIAAFFGGLFRIDPVSLEVTTVDPDFEISDMAIDPDGLLYLLTPGPGSSELVRYDPIADSVTPLLDNEDYRIAWIDVNNQGTVMTFVVGDGDSVGIIPAFYELNPATAAMTLYSGSGNSQTVGGGLDIGTVQHFVLDGSGSVSRAQYWSLY